MNAKVLREGRVRLWLEPEDRGLAYGDGLFETLLVVAGAPAMWREHWARLGTGAARLGISMPEEAMVRREASSLIEGRDRAALKIVLTRGLGPRGYAAPEHDNPTVVLSCHDAPPVPADGLVLRWCKTRMAVQPLLAGIKHLNRLEQVLARAEWNDPSIHDGILCDMEDRVVCATSANLFARVDGRWLTPTVANCGVAGTIRGWLLGQGAAVEAELSQAQVSHAEVLFACNSLRGILPVRRLGQHAWPAHPEVLALRRRLADAHSAYVFQE
ncbi:aminodeoxychorismate lyase [soil metagenome]